MAEIKLPTNQVQEFAGLLSRKRWWVALPGLAGLAVGMVVLCFVPKRYESWTRIEVRPISFEEDARMRNPADVIYLQNLQNVEPDVKAAGRIHRVLAEKLQWSDYLALATSEKRKEYLDKVMDRMQVERARKEKDAGSSFVTIKYRDEDPKRAAAFAKTIADFWMEDSIAAYKDQVERELNELKKNQDAANERLAAAHQAVRVWQEQHDLSPTQPRDRKTTTEEDHIVREFQEVKQTVANLTGDLKVYTDRYEKARERWAQTPRFIQQLGAPGAALPGAPAGPPDLAKLLVDQQAKLRIDLFTKQNDLKNLKPANIRYGQIQSTIEDLQREIAAIDEKLSAAGRVTSTGAVEEPKGITTINPARLDRENELQEAEKERDTFQNKLDLAQARLAELTEPYNQRPAVFDRYRLLEAEEGLREADYKYAQDTVEKKNLLLLKIVSPAGNPYRINSAVEAAEKPVEPNSFLYLAGGFFGGAGLGLALVLLREFGRSSFRGVDDAATSLPIPVLGHVNRITTSVERRRERVRGATGIAAALAGILVVGVVAGLYLFEPKALPGAVRDAFDSVKQSFR